MPAANSRAWGALSTAFLLWMLVGFSAVFWWLRLAGGGRGEIPVPPAVVAGPQTDAAAVGRLLGGEAPVAERAAAQSPSRFALLGVVAGRSRDGAALISVDGKPARPYRVGAQVDAGLVLQAVAPRSAQLGPAGDAPASITLDLPIPRPATAGTPSVAAPAMGTAPLPAPRFASQAPVPAPGSPSLSQIAPDGNSRAP